MDSTLNIPPDLPGFLEFKAYGGQTGSDITVSRGDLSLRERLSSVLTRHWKPITGSSA